MKLIDADKMLKRIESWNTSDAMDKALYNFTLNRIIEQPTVDAVPIIRCKDCMWWHEHGQYGCSHDFGADDYCSKGSRKDAYVTLHHDDIHFKNEESEKAFYDALERKEE